MEKAIEIKRRAQRCVQNGDLDGALGEYEKLVAADDSEPYNFVLLADLLYKKGDHAGAARRYLSATDAYQKNQLYKNAIAVCKKMVRLSLSPAIVLQRLAILHGLDGLTTEAALYHMQHADLMLREAKPGEAAVSLKNAYEICPDNLKTLERLADVNLVKGDKDAAVAALLEAIQRYEQSGQGTHAERCRSRLAQIRPGAVPRAEAARSAGPASPPAARFPGRERLGEEESQAPSSGDDAAAGGFPATGAASGTNDAYAAPPAAEGPGLRFHSPAEAVEEEPPPAPEPPALEIDRAPAFEGPALEITRAHEFVAPSRAPEPAPPATGGASADGAYDGGRHAHGAHDGGRHAHGAHDGGTHAHGAHDGGTHADGTHDGGTHADGTAGDRRPAPEGMAKIERLLLSAQEQFRAGRRDVATSTLVEAASVYEELRQFDNAATIYRSLSKSATAARDVMLLWLKNCEVRRDLVEAAQVSCELGDLALNEGDHAGARSWFKRARSFDATNALAYRRLERLRDGGAADDDGVVEAGVGTAPAPPPPSPAPAGLGPQGFEPGRVEVEVGRGGAVTFDLGSLVSEFQRGIESQISGDAQGHYDLAMTYREMGLLEQAIDAFRNAATDPAFVVRCAEMIGRSLLDEGRFDDAARELEAGLNLPGLTPVARADLRYQLGLAHEAAGRVQKALEDFERVYAMHPGYPDVALKIRVLRKTLESL